MMFYTTYNMDKFAVFKRLKNHWLILQSVFYLLQQPILMLLVFLTS